MEKEIFHCVQNRNRCCCFVKWQIETKVDGIYNRFASRLLENVGRCVVGLFAIILWNLWALAGFFSSLGNFWNQYPFHLIPSDQGCENVLEMRKVRIGPTVVPNVFPHEVQAIILGLESRNLVWKVFCCSNPILGISILTKNTTVFRRMLILGEFVFAGRGEGCHFGIELQLLLDKSFREHQYERASLSAIYLRSINLTVMDGLAAIMTQCRLMMLLFVCWT